MVNRSLTHRERIETCLAGHKPDRVPVALWRHFPVDDQSPEGLAAATAQFQRTFDFDLIKVTPSSSYCLKDWGVRDEWLCNPEGTREYTGRVIQAAEDWASLPILDPRQGALGAQLECLRLLVNEFDQDTPILQTVFSPLSQAKNLAGPGELPVYLHRDPDLLQAGLRTITESTLRFVEEAAKTGIAGIFYAVQQCQYGILSPDEFEHFEKPSDLHILKAAGDLPVNLLHLHGEDLMFDLTVDYPVEIVNWHDRQTPPSLSQASDQFPGVLCGGIRQWETMVLGTPEQVIAEAQDAIEQTGGQRFILGTGCVVPITAPYGNLLAARQIVEA